MSVTGTIVVNARMDSKNYLVGTGSITSDAGYKTSDTVENNNAAIAVAIPAFLIAKCEGLYFSSDYDCELTLVGTGNANNSVFTLVANEAQEWHNGSAAACPVTHNCISATCINNNQAANSTLTGRIWVNA
jgi:hypothetical protein